MSNAEGVSDTTFGTAYQLLTSICLHYVELNVSIYYLYTEMSMYTVEAIVTCYINVL